METFIEVRHNGFGKWMTLADAEEYCMTYSSAYTGNREIEFSSEDIDAMSAKEYDSWFNWR